MNCPTCDRALDQRVVGLAKAMIELKFEPYDAVQRSIVILGIKEIRKRVRDRVRKMRNGSAKRGKLSVRRVNVTRDPVVTKPKLAKNSKLYKAKVEALKKARQVLAESRKKVK